MPGCLRSTFEDMLCFTILDSLNPLKLLSQLVAPNETYRFFIPMSHLQVLELWHNIPALESLSPGGSPDLFQSCMAKSHVM